MGVSPFRFLHLDQLSLDVPYEGVGSLSDEAAEQLAFATLETLENVQTLATEEQVDFVLVTGVLFGAAPPSLATQSALRNLGEYLQQAEIQLIMVPQQREIDMLGPDYWDQLSAQILTSKQKVVVSTRRSSVQAETNSDFVELSLWSQSGESRSSSSRKSAFRISVYESEQPYQLLLSALNAHPSSTGILPEDYTHDFEAVVKSVSRATSADYVALSGLGVAARTQRDDGEKNVWFESPGVVMPRTFAEAQASQNGNVSLVTVESRTETQTEIEVKQLRVSPVRLVPVAIEVSFNMNRDELLQQLQGELDRLSPQPSEHLFVLNWMITGAGPLLFDLLERETQREFEEKLSGYRALLHCWEVVPNRNEIQQTLSEDQLANQFLEHLKQYEEANRTELTADFLTAFEGQSHWQQRLRQIANEVSSEAVLAAASRQGASFIAGYVDKERVA